MTTAAVILAAGGGTRFVDPGGIHKLLASFDGRPLVAWAVDAALAGGCDHTWVVAGAADLGAVLPEEVELLANPNWANGQAGSLQVAVSAGRQRGVDALVVGLGDQPGIPGEAWRRVAAAVTPIAVATYQGRRRNPVRLHRSVWDLLPSGGDVGARVLFRDRPDLVSEVACPGDPKDIDTREDLDSAR